MEPGNPYNIGDHIYELLTAGGCTPLMLPPVDLFGLRFAEGGIRNCTPLDLAVEAFEIAMQNGYDEAEFIVIDNYVHEPNYESYDLVDSGLEIIGRTLKMMTIQIAQADIYRGRVRLEKLGVNSNVILIQPTKDFRLSPFNFNDLVTRLAIRNHGVTRATMLIPQHPVPQLEMMAFTAAKTFSFKSLLDNFNTENEEIDHADRLVASILADPTLNDTHFNSGLAAQVNKAPLTEAINQQNIAYPGNLAELSSLMTDACKNNKKIKAVGAGFAFDDIITTSGLQLSLKEMNNIVNVDAQLLNDPTMAGSLVEFEAGATIDQLNKYLWAQDRALINQPGYEGLSFIGVASCGGHGSGKTIGPLAEAICALNLMTFDATGKLVQKRIEPTAGISDPVKFKASSPNVELIQDDKHFNAVKVSVGLMGVFCSVTIKTQPAFFLEETRVMQKWSELKPVIFQKLADTTIHSIHIWFNPYPVAGENYCVLSEYRRVNGPAKGKRPFGVTFGLIPELAPLILWTMEHFPGKLPEIINSTLKATVDKTPIVMPCPEALNFGTPNLTKVDAFNCGIPLEKMADVAEKLFELAANRLNDGAFISVPPGFRFTAAADGYLAPQYKRETCMIEMPFIRPTPQAMDTIDAFLQMYMNDFAGRPHWGQRLNQNVTPAALKSMYPELDAFKEIFDVFNYNGIFDNEFSQKIGLS